MTNEQVVTAFFRGDNGNSLNMTSWADGKLFSYRTLIAEFGDDGELYINITRYSNTTSKHQSIVKNHDMLKVYSKPIFVKNVPINTRYDLSDYV